MKEILKLLRKVKEKNKNVYICGNGGSASTANHFANDLVKMCGMKAISLCANQAIVMAYANDNGYENIFVEQLKVFYEKGDILVTSMTRPEFVPLMKKAGAIITNEGGITSHAAIISRELKIPCIIGTKNATVILKDGDFVEVDANNGIITILKKYKK